MAGATGLVGKSLLDQLLSDSFYSKVIVLSRRELTVKDSRLQVVLTSFDDFEALGKKVQAHHYFCCLGTTARKAGSKEAFFEVDYTYCHELGKLAMADAVCEQFHVVTALGANSDSVIYYNKVKGLLEESLKKLGLPSLYIYQPSLLLGDREETRPMEEVAKFFSAVLSFFMVGSKGRRFFAIEAKKVAEAMVIVAKKEERGTHTYTSRAIERLVAQPKAAREAE